MGKGNANEKKVSLGAICCYALCIFGCAGLAIYLAFFLKDMYENDVYHDVETYDPVTNTTSWVEEKDGKKFDEFLAISIVGGFFMGGCVIVATCLVIFLVCACVCTPISLCCRACCGNKKETSPDPVDSVTEHVNAIFNL